MISVKALSPQTNLRQFVEQVDWILIVSYINSSEFTKLFFWYIVIPLSVIISEHKASTTLKLVGLQVWRGALILADFILHNNDIFHDKNVLELGSGVGLTSIAAALYAKEVIATGEK